MASPQRIYQYYTDAELQVELANLKAATSGGDITNTGGGGKSASFQFMDLAQRWEELNYELNIRAGKHRAQKVVNVICPDRLEIF
jgi:hypothetical protein